MLTNSKSGAQALAKPLELRLEVLLNEAKSLSACLKAIPDEHAKLIQGIGAKDLEKVFQHKDRLYDELHKLPFTKFSPNNLNEWIQIITELEPLLDQLLVLEEVVKHLTQAEVVADRELVRNYLNFIDQKCLSDIKNALVRQLETGVKELKLPRGTTKNVPAHGAPASPDAPAAPAAPTLPPDFGAAMDQVVAASKALKKTPVVPKAPAASGSLNAGVLANALSGLKHIDHAEKPSPIVSKQEAAINALVKKFENTRAEDDDDEEDVSEDTSEGSSTKAEQEQAAAAKKEQAEAAQREQAEKERRLAKPQPKPNPAAAARQPDSFQQMRNKIASARPAAIKPAARDANDGWDEPPTPSDDGSEDLQTQLPPQRVIGKVKLEGISAKLSSVLAGKLNLIKKPANGKIIAAAPNPASKKLPQPKKLAIGAELQALLGKVIHSKEAAQESQEKLQVDAGVKDKLSGVINAKLGKHVPKPSANNQPAPKKLNLSAAHTALLNAFCGAHG